MADLRTKEQVWEAQQAALREVAQLTAKLQSIPGWEGMASSGYGGAADGQINAVAQLVAGVAGAWLVWESVALLNRARAGMRDAALKPMRLFHWSNSYLAIVFIAAAVDPLLPWG